MANRERSLLSEIVRILIQIIQAVIIGLFDLILSFAKAVLEVAKHIPTESIKGFFQLLRETKSGKLVLFIIGINVFCLGCLLMDTFLSGLNMIPYIRSSVWGTQFFSFHLTLQAVVNAYSFSQLNDVGGLTKVMTGASVAGVVAELSLRAFVPSFLKK